MKMFALLMVGGCFAMSAAAVTVEKSEFIFETAPYRSCHASSIAETKSGLIVAWFGGSDEGKPDVTVWTARHDGTNWLSPVEVATGVQTNGTRFPCWNPVLFQPASGPL